MELAPEGRLGSGGERGKRQLENKQKIKEQKKLRQKDDTEEAEE